MSDHKNSIRFIANNLRVSASVYSNHSQVKMNVYRNDLLSIIDEAPPGEEPSTDQIIPPLRQVLSASMVV